MNRKSAAIVVLCAVLSACAARRSSPVAREPVAALTAEPARSPAPPTAARDAKAWLNTAFEKAGVTRSAYPTRSDIAKLRDVGVDEARLVLAIEDDAARCRERGATELETANPDACESVGVWEALLEEIADPSPERPSPALKLLVRLDVRVERLLERRFLAIGMSCVPPDPAEVRLKAETLRERVVAVGAGGHRSRFLSAAERDDLAYALLAVEDSGPAVGSLPEDAAAPALPPDSLERSRHEQRQQEMGQARLEGDLDRYLNVGLSDLVAFGYPGPLRVNADGDMRWGGAGLSYELRDVAKVAELMGRRAIAHDLYRRANPGGGVCGTTYESRKQQQIAGLIRTAPDCRGVTADILYAVDESESYGPAVLARAGFDVARIYRGLLSTVHTADDWATRTRAIRGLADVAKGRSLDALIALAGPPTDARTEAEIVEALGDVAAVIGVDPCDPDAGIHLGSFSSNLPRQVTSANVDCRTRLTPSQVLRVKLAVRLRVGSKDATVRAAAVEALGHLDDEAERVELARVASDDHDHWVRAVAKIALEEMDRTERARAEAHRPSVQRR